MHADRSYLRVTVSVLHVWMMCCNFLNTFMNSNGLSQGLVYTPYIAYKKKKKSLALNAWFATWDWHQDGGDVQPGDGVRTGFRTSDA